MRYSGRIPFDLVVRVYNRQIDCVPDIDRVLISCWKYHNECLYKAGRELTSYDNYIKNITQGELLTLIKSRAVVVRHLEDIDKAVGVINEHFRLKLIKGGKEN